MVEVPYFHLMKNAGLRNFPVRRLISLAIDKPKIFEKLLSGLIVLFEFPISKGIFSTQKLEKLINGVYRRISLSSKCVG